MNLVRLFLCLAVLCVVSTLSAAQAKACDDVFFGGSSFSFRSSGFDHRPRVLFFESGGHRGGGDVFIREVDRRRGGRRVVEVRRFSF